MEWILVAGYLFLFIALILRAPGLSGVGIPRSWFVTAFCLKVISGISLGLIYTYYYPDRATADTFKFFDDSKIMFDTLFSKPYDFIRMFTGIGGEAPELRKYYAEMDFWLNKDVMFNDNKTIIRLNVLFRFFSMNKYFVHVVFINFISFIGLVCIFKTLASYIPSAAKLIFCSTFLLPSVMFWGSGLLKDGLLIFAFGLMLYTFNQLLSNQVRTKNLLIFLLSFVLLVFTKLYVLISIFPGMIAWIWSRNNRGWKVALKFVSVYFIYFVIVFNIYHVFPEYNVADIIYWKQKNFNTLVELTRAKSVIEIPQLDYGLKSILLNSPTAFFNTFLRPFPGDVNRNPLILISLFENVLILLVVAATFIYRKKDLDPVSPIILFSLFFVLLMFVLAGLITPILGALVRYRVPALPFLLFLLISIIDHERLLSRLAFYKRKIFQKRVEE